MKAVSYTQKTRMEEVIYQLMLKYLLEVSAEDLADEESGYY